VYFRTFKVISPRDEGLAGGFRRGVGLAGERAYVGRACALTFASVGPQADSRRFQVRVVRTFHGTGSVLNMPGRLSRLVQRGCSSVNSCATCTRDDENTARGVVVSNQRQTVLESFKV
jgi:hypothetical protein